MHEFKFRKSSKSIKKKFFETVHSLNYRVVLTIIDKRKISDKNLQKNPGEFYYNVILQALQGGGEFDKANIIIDGEKGVDHRRKVKVYFRKNLPYYSVNSISFVDSKKNNLVQLADMIIGAAMQSIGNRNNANEYIELVKKRIVAEINEL